MVARRQLQARRPGVQSSEAGGAEDGHPPAEFGLDVEVFGEDAAHLELEGVVALLGPVGREGVEGALLVQVDEPEPCGRRDPSNVDERAQQRRPEAGVLECAVDGVQLGDEVGDLGGVVPARQPGEAEVVFGALDLRAAVSIEQRLYVGLGRGERAALGLAVADRPDAGRPEARLPPRA